jgi:SAM-dependent methyltransferase
MTDDPLMIASTACDRWAAASTYEHFMGRWSRTLARDFIQWLEPAARLHWLELGCGTGALTNAICNYAEPASVTACDPAAPFVEYARQNLGDVRASFVVAGADDFPLRSGGYDVVASLLAFNFFPVPGTALERMRSATVPGGIISACVWDYAGEMQFLRYFWNAAVKVDPSASELDEGRRFPICNPDTLMRVFRDADLIDVRGEPLDIATEFESIEDYWKPFLGCTGPAPSFVASLNAQKRGLLRAELERVLPRDTDGTIRLRARAWAVRGNTTKCSALYARSFDVPDQRGV